LPDRPQRVTGGEVLRASHRCLRRAATKGGFLVRCRGRSTVEARRHVHQLARRDRQVDPAQYCETAMDGQAQILADIAAACRRAQRPIAPAVLAARGARRRRGAP
jgi:hypothetical protein